MQATRTGIAFVSVAALWFSLFVLPSPTPAQDLVASEDLVGGSSVFVFKEGKKKPQQHAAVASRRHNLEAQSARAKHIGAQTTAAVQKRRLATIAARKKVVRSTDRREALSNTLTIKAEEFLDKGETDLAVSNFRDALKQNAKNGRATDGLSNALTAKGIEIAGDANSAAAIPYFEEAAKLDPKNDVAFARMGAIYDQQGNEEKAISNYERAVTLNSEYKDLYPQLGIAYAEQGQVAKAEEQLRNAEKAGLDSADVEYLRGLVAFKNNRDQDALAAFAKAAGSEARFVDAQYYRGQILARQGKNAEAVASYRGALQKDPTFAPAAFDLGVEEYNAGNYTEASAAYKEALRLDPDNFQAHAYLASTYRQLEQYPLANSEYKTASAAINTSDLYSEWGYCLGKTVEWDKATARLNTAAQLTPTAIDNSNVGWAYYNAGQVQTAAKNDPAAKASFESARDFSQRAVTLDPKLAAGYLNLGSAHNSLGEFQQAVQALNSALSLRGDWLIALNQLGAGYRGLNDLPNAIATFKRAVDLDPKNVPGLWGLGSAYSASGNKKEAKAVAEQLRRVDPTVAAKLDLVIKGKIVDEATRKVKQKLPSIPRFPY